MKKIAICGSEDKYFTPAQRTDAVKKIRDILNSHALRYGDGNAPEYDYNDLIMVSGGCPHSGIDIWAEIVADILGVQKEIYLPEVNQWEDEIVHFGYQGLVHMGYESLNRKGYKSRNIQIAEACDVLYCIDPKGRKWSGGRFTMEAARKLSKEVHLVEID